MIKLKVLLFFMFFTNGYDLKAQTFALSDFVEAPAPKVYSNEWRKLNNDVNEFRVANDNGVLRIAKASSPDDVKLVVKGDTLIGIDKGEWGGELRFVTKAKKTQIIKRGNIKFIFKFHDQIYFIEGLAHGGYNAGAIFELNRKDTSFKYQLIIQFDDAPEAMTIYKDDLLIASFSGLYRIHNFVTEIIFKKEFWDSLYPNSIVAFDNRTTYMGVRGGYVMIDLANKTYKFYRYKN